MSLPLHPMIVHVPMALAILMPLAALLAGWAVWSGRLTRRAWVPVVVLQALLVASAMTAINTGQREEDRVETIVPRTALHQHEEYAEQFAWATAAVLALALAGLVPQRRGMRAAAVATFAGTLMVAGMGVRVGHAGGALVYTHGAASAYLPAEGTARARALRGSAYTDAARAGTPAAPAGPDATRAAAHEDDEHGRH